MCLCSSCLSLPFTDISFYHQCNANGLDELFSFFRIFKIFLVDTMGLKKRNCDDDGHVTISFQAFFAVHKKNSSFDLSVLCAEAQAVSDIVNHHSRVFNTDTSQILLPTPWTGGLCMLI